MKRSTTTGFCAAFFTAVFTASWAATSAPAFADYDPEVPLDDACWEQGFVDDFDTLDLIGPDNPDGQWKPAYIWPADVIINQELQYYVDPAVLGDEHSPFSVTDGVLTIEAKPTPPALLGSVAGQPYVSGVLTTENGFSQRHGRFEALLKPPAGQGLWSAFWLLPSFEQWPAGVAVLPEIDVMEHIGHEPNTVHTTLHTNQNGTLESFPYDHTVGDDLTRGFHRYSVVWTAEAVHGQRVPLLSGWLCVQQTTGEILAERRQQLESTVDCQLVDRSVGRYIEVIDRQRFCADHRARPDGNDARHAA